MIRRTLWRICGTMYAFAAKPLLFLIPPDHTHHMMIKTTSFFGRFGIARWFVRFIFSKKTNPILHQKYHGIDFKTPIGLSAGFDKNAEIVPMIGALGFGFGTVGSVTADNCVGNPRPWFYRLPNSKSFVVNAGLANFGSRNILKRIHNYSKKALRNFPVVLSVAKTNSECVVDVQEGIDDYVATVTRAKHESNVTMIELNISCPNAFGGEAFTTPDKLERLLTAVDKTGNKKPVYIKMPIDLDWDDFSRLLDVATKHKIVGVTISNLYKNRQKANLNDELPDSIKGNLSGKPTWHKSNELIEKTYKSYGDKLTIIGVGGVFNAKDAYTKIKLGASLVEIISGVIFCGPQLAAEIADDLAGLVKADGYEHISDAIGIDTK